MAEAKRVCTGWFETTSDGAVVVAPFGNRQEKVEAAHVKKARRMLRNAGVPGTGVDG